MPLKIQGQRFAKRNSFFAAVFLTLILSIITGCSSAFNGQKTDVSFCIDSNTAKEILSMAGISEAPEASGARSVVKEEDLQSSKITVWLKGDVEQAKTKDFSENGVSISFDKIPVGASVWAEAEIYYTDSSAQKVVFCEGKSEEPIVIKAGNKNSLNLKFKVEIKKYNQIIKTDTTYTVLNPILTYQQLSP